MSNFVTRTDQTRDDWQTPEFIVKALGTFDLDPCANMENPTRLATYGYPVCGLNMEWFGRVWCNPPYGDQNSVTSRLSAPIDWIRKLDAHGNGIALIPPRVGSKWFHEEVLERADALLFMKGRINFLDGNLKPIVGNNADSVLIAFGAFNVSMLTLSGLPGKLWRLR